MKKKLVLASMMFLTTTVHAENWYIDGGYSAMKFDDGVDTLSPGNLYIRGGYQFNDYFNVGLESNVTVSEDQVDSAPNVDFSVTAATLYVRGGLPLNESIWVYAQVGTTNTELTGEFQGIEVSQDDNDTMLGLGAEFDVGTSGTYIAVNYSKYNDNDGVDVSATNIGLGVRF